IRRLLLTGHYRETFNFTIAGLEEARAALARLDECLAKLDETAAGAKAEPDAKLVAQFTEALDEDLNVSAGWGVVFDWVREMNRVLASNQLSPAQAAAALAAWRKIDSVFGLARKEEAGVPAEPQALLEARQAARKAKDSKRGDA